ncbi:MAG TPA: FAD:protein FMN transferase [bacterium]|nr:FAD:protein FMN transferase [bacterium]
MRRVSWFWFLLLFAAIAAIVLVSLFYENAAGETAIIKVDNFLLGTLVDIKAWDQTLDEQAVRAAIQSALDAMRRVESEMSVNVKSSVVHRINDSAGRSKVLAPRSVISVLDSAARVSELSEGAFDVRIGAVSDLWDFASLENPAPPDPQAIAREVRLVAGASVEFSATSGTVYLPTEGMRLDLGGIAKGYAIDVASEALRKAGILNFIVDAGGDMFVSGTRPNGRKWRIGVRDPRRPGDLMCTLLTTDRAIVTSGDYERFFIYEGRRYHHILDPATGYPASECQSVTVIAKEATVADALATAIFVMGPERGLQLADRLQDIECLIVGADGSRCLSSRLGHYLPSVMGLSP